MSDKPKPGRKLPNVRLGNTGRQQFSARKLPAPPSSTSDLADRIPILDALHSFFKAFFSEILTAFGLLKWHSLAALISALAVIGVDVFSAAQLKSNGGQLPAIAYWDSSFLTLLLFIAVDAGIKYSQYEQRKFDQISPLVGAAQYFASATSVLFPVILPGSIRFYTALPAGYRGEGLFLFFILKLFFIFIAISALGGLASLIAKGSIGTNKKHVSRGVWFLIPLTVAAGFISPFALELNNLVSRFILSFSVGGILILGSQHSPLFTLDITLPDEIQLAFAVLISLFSCVFSYIFVSMIIGAVNLALQVLPAKLAASRFLAAFPIGLSSALAAAIGVYLVVGETQFAGLRHPSENTAFFPIPSLVLTGFGLAIAASYIHSKTEPESESYRKANAAWQHRPISLEYAQFAMFLPFFTFIAAIGALGLSPVLDLMTILIAWTISFVSGAALVKLVHLLTSPEKRRLATSIMTGAAVMIFTFGAYGTPTAANSFWQYMNPYEAASGLLGQIADLTVFQRGLYVALIVSAWIVASNLGKPGAVFTSGSRPKTAKHKQ